MKRDNVAKDILHLYDLYCGRIFKFIFVLTNDYYIAQDLTYDTFMKVNNSYYQLKKQEKVETWLFQIAHNISINYIRRKKLNVVERIRLSSNGKEVAPSIENTIIINEDFKELYQALIKLKPSYREVIILRKVEELSIKETSEILGWKESKVTTTLSRALKELQKKLEAGGYVYEQSS
ncbi:RNA polymerase sigma factor [Cytobacillus sp. IB215665]|uniref:RNA polymerase sigma factor n=1 Tax=Cytobacillus sp. IB215665 TaxID=3097357 RepID=UPI002A152BC7|nr:RNA polymerase sigma factor [Cytobacillus sp. IB215665]MDX8366044.1 RNA polymerase sigma factor [Cytobacillus sp. IB215665]